MPGFSENFRQRVTLGWQANYKYYGIQYVQVSFLSAGILYDQYFTAIQHTKNRYQSGYSILHPSIYYPSMHPSTHHKAMHAILKIFLTEKSRKEEEKMTQETGLFKRNERRKREKRKIINYFPPASIFVTSSRSPSDNCAIAAATPPQRTLSILLQKSFNL